LVLHQVLPWVNSTVAGGSCVKLDEMGIWKMNTVWILILFSHAAYPTAGPEFNTQQKCEVARATIVKQVEEARWGTTVKSMCIRIEK